MDNINYEMLSNKELTERYEELNQQFEIAQTQLKENYLKMVTSSEEAIKIKEILSKRGVK